MMPPELEETLERSMRTVIDATTFDCGQRAIVNVILHQALVDLHTKINSARLADCNDIDTLSAALDASIRHNETLTAQLAEAQTQVGAYESAAEDADNDRRECDLIIENLQVKVNRLTADLAAARQPTATAQTTVIEQPHVNGTAPTTSTARPTNGTRKMSKEELLTLTVDHIKALAKELGRTPTLVDFNETRERAGLPVWNSLTERLERSWMSLVLAADLTPNKPGPRPAAETGNGDKD